MSLLFVRVFFLFCFVLSFIAIYRVVCGVPKGQLTVNIGTRYFVPLKIGVIWFYLLNVLALFSGKMKGIIARNDEMEWGMGWRRCFPPLVWHSKERNRA